MSSLKFNIKELGGQWQGTHHLYLKPNELTGDGLVKLNLSPIMKEKVIKIDYSQIIEEKEYLGIFLITILPEQKCEAAWIDEFHTGLGIMKFSGDFKSKGLIFQGGYQAGEDFWKWTIEFSFESDILWIRHYNQPPRGDKYLGIEIQLTRD